MSCKFLLKSVFKQALNLIKPDSVNKICNKAAVHSSNVKNIKEKTYSFNKTCKSFRIW